jgi:hypothetical protein
MDEVLFCFDLVYILRICLQETRRTTKLFNETAGSLGGGSNWVLLNLKKKAKSEI